LRHGTMTLRTVHKATPTSLLICGRRVGRRAAPSSFQHSLRIRTLPIYYDTRDNVCRSEAMLGYQCLFWQRSLLQPFPQGNSNG
jgi:hypothetical protein